MAYRSPGAAAHAVPLRKPAGWWRHAVAALALVVYLGAGVACARTLWQRWQAMRYVQRGVAFGPRALIAGAGVDPLGVNVALEQHGDERALARSLDLLAAGGFRWLRQRFPWAEIEPARGDYRWERWDAIVRLCRERRFMLVAVLDGSPAWARAPEDAANPLAPPRNPADLATFARAFATRYGDAVDAYQIWDNPNIYPHWGERDPDPAAYLRLLRAARTQIRDVDPGAAIVCAGLSPTTEVGGRNVSELLFLRGMYAARGRDLFDVVAVQAFGFWSGPEDRRVAPDVLNFSRVVAVREEMERQGDGQKPVWAVAWGWNALPEGWSGRPSPWGTDAPWRQHDRDLRALRRAREEWPWLGLMCYAAWQPAVPADDPLWGLALLDAQGNPQPLYDRLRALAQAPPVLYPGWHTVDVVGAQAASAVEVRFWGSGLSLSGPGRWELVALDGRPLARTVSAGRGPATVARGLPAAEHRLLLRPVEAVPSLQVAVWRERSPFLPLPAAAAILAAALLATAALYRLLRPYPWRAWLVAAVAAYRALPPWTALAVVAAELAALAAAPNPSASLLALVILALLILTRPEAGIALTVFLVPLAPLVKWFGPLRFSYLEMVTLLSVAALLAHELLALARSLRGQALLPALSARLRGAPRRLTALDLGVAFLLGASFLSLLASEWLWVSLRELRVVVLQALFIYCLVVRSRPDREGLLRLADLLVVGAVAVCVHGLFQYVWTDDVVIAEGVRRMRGIYGSPNNLALVLGRVFPLMLAVALCGPDGWRRRLYRLAAALAAACLFLTFSRGGWLFGVPAALLVLALLGGRQARVAVAGLALLGLVLLVPLLGTARFGSLLSLRGTSLFRVKLWEAAWEMARDHPWLGVGLDNFLYQYPRYIRPEALSEPNLSHPHDLVLDFWLRLGLPGLVAFGWLQWHFFRRGLSLWRRRTDPALWVLAVGLLAGMADMLAHGLVDASFFVVELAGLFAVMVALVRQLGATAQDQRGA